MENPEIRASGETVSHGLEGKLNKNNTLLDSTSQSKIAIYASWNAESKGIPVAFQGSLDAVFHIPSYSMLFSSQFSYLKAI